MKEEKFDLGLREKGKYIPIMKPKGQVITFISLMIAPLFNTLLSLYTFSNIIAICILQAMLYLYMIIALTIFLITCFVEPGIIPGYQIYSDLTDYLKNIFSQRLQDQDFDSQPLAIVISHQVTPIPLVITHRSGNKISIKYCTQCQIFKTPLAGHSKEMCKCILRLDHFCPYIGQYQGLYNSRMYYMMLPTLQSYLFFCLGYYIMYCIVFSLNLAKKFNQYKDSIIGIHMTDKGHLGLNITFLIISLGIFGILVQYTHAVSELIYIHKKFLTYHTQTRHQSNKQVLGNYGYNYTLFSRKDNLKDIQVAAKNRYKPFSNTALFVRYIKTLVNKNKDINSFDDLLERMRQDKKVYTPELQWLLEFTFLCAIVEKECFNDDYQPVFLEDEAFLQAFEGFIDMFKQQFQNALKIIPNPIQRRNALLELILSNLLTYLEQIVPYIAYKADGIDINAINETLKAGTPILNCSALVTSMIACRIDLMHSFRERDDAISYDEFIQDPQNTLYTDDKMRLKFDICGIECECLKCNQKVAQDEYEAIQNEQHLRTPKSKKIKISKQITVKDGKERQVPVISSPDYI